MINHNSRYFDTVINVKMKRMSVHNVYVWEETLVELAVVNDDDKVVILV